MSLYTIPTLPLSNNIESIAVLKKTISAHKLLAELKGLALTIPNQEILISTLSLQESKDSSEIENIITTHDEVFQLRGNTSASAAAKEVSQYSKAIFYGYNQVKKNGLITNNLILDIGRILTPSIQSFRKIPGTTLQNEQTSQIVYTPPQKEENIQRHMKNLEMFINDSSISTLDSLVKMAIIHHQFESIHPFHDGNGRTGRIINILYLISQGVLESPILCLSRYITQNKNTYYKLLQKVREEDAWEEWIIYILDALESTARQTIVSIKEIKNLMNTYKVLLKEKEEGIYSHELLNTIFSYPYTKIEFIVNATGVSRQTASKYLKKLVDIGILEFKKEGNTNYYINTKLVNIFESL